MVTDSSTHKIKTDSKKKLNISKIDGWWQHHTAKS